MTRNLKTVGFVLIAVFALGAGAQGAWASDNHEFKSDGQKTILTGGDEGVLVIAAGAVGTVECTDVVLEGTVDAGAGQTEVDRMTFKYTIGSCSFGGQPASVFTNECAFVFDTDTTTGNSTGNKHAISELECSGGSKIQIHTVNCTITIGPQTITHELSYKNEQGRAFTVTATAHNITIGRERNTAAQPANGCLLFPTGAVGKFVGASTIECFKDEDSNAQSNPTTPGITNDQTLTDCEITGV